MGGVESVGRSSVVLKEEVESVVGSSVVLTKGVGGSSVLLAGWVNSV